MKKIIKSIIKYFTSLEWIIWLGGLAIVLVTFFIDGDKNFLSLFSSFFGISCVIFMAKGNVAGQFIAIGFSLLYGILSYTKAYYGEMLIYFCLMLPIHIASIVMWLKNLTGKKGHVEVKVNTLKKSEYIIAIICWIALTFAFYFLLKFLKTDNLIVSTISLMTSLGAAYLMLRRCEYYSLCFILNDVVLIVLWSLKMFAGESSLLPSVICFVVFLITDTYAFISWKKMKRRQQNQQLNDNTSTIS